MFTNLSSKLILCEKNLRFWNSDSETVLTALRLNAINGYSTYNYINRNKMTNVWPSVTKPTSKLYDIAVQKRHSA